MHRFYLLIFFFSIVIYGNAQDWVPLFNGFDLSDFVVMNGTADYYVEDSAIVGVSKVGTVNTFLATKQNYGDFILEFEVRIDSGLNSGVQIRSTSDVAINNGQVHGYQVEIETSERGWSGGIYDEGRRGWLYPLSVNDAARAAFKTTKWNKYRIEAIGTEIRTWVNDIACARLTDDLSSTGIIAFQVHAIADKNQANKKVRWRNIRILTEKPEMYRVNPTSDIAEVSYLKNKLSRSELDEGWELLWDGISINHWKLPKHKPDSQKGWILDDGVLVVATYSGNGADESQDLITEDIFSEFILELDFMVTGDSESGIIYGTNGPERREYQIADDNLFSEKGQENMTTGSLAGILAAGNLSEQNRDTKRFWGVGNWSKARIVVKEGIVEHWLNQVKVLEYPASVTGPIVLQNQGSEVRFRSIKLKRIK